MFSKKLASSVLRFPFVFSFNIPRVSIRNLAWARSSSFLFVDGLGISPKAIEACRERVVTKKLKSGWGGTNLPSFFKVSFSFSTASFQLSSELFFISSIGLINYDSGVTHHTLKILGDIAAGLIFD